MHVLRVAFEQILFVYRIHMTLLHVFTSRLSFCRVNTWEHLLSLLSHFRQQLYDATRVHNKHISIMLLPSTPVPIPMNATYIAAI